MNISADANRKNDEDALNTLKIIKHCEATSTTSLKQNL